MARPHGLDRRGADMLRRREVGFAERELQNVNAFGPQFASFGGGGNRGGRGKLIDKFGCVHVRSDLTEKCVLLCRKPVAGLCESGPGLVASPVTFVPVPEASGLTEAGYRGKVRVSAAKIPGFDASDDSVVGFRQGQPSETCRE